MPQNHRSTGWWTQIHMSTQDRYDKSMWTQILSNSSRMIQNMATQDSTIQDFQKSFDIPRLLECPTVVSPTPKYPAGAQVGSCVGFGPSRARLLGTATRSLSLKPAEGWIGFLLEAPRGNPTLHLNLEDRPSISGWVYHMYKRVYLRI